LPVGSSICSSAGAPVIRGDATARPLGSLCACCEGPRRRRAAEHRDELAASAELRALRDGALETCFCHSETGKSLGQT